MVKLIDYRQKSATSESVENPFAIVVMAHLAAQETRNNPTHRFATKLAITRRLYERGYEKETIINLFCFIDWVMTLPEELDQQFDQELYDYEEKSNMQYVGRIERSGLPIIAQLKSPKELTTFQNRLKAAQTADELKRFYKLKSQND